jgi:hypothetical protein
MRHRLATVISSIALATLGLASPTLAQSVTVFGDYPDTGRCDQSFGPNNNFQTFNYGCNDSASGIDVPWGMSATLCDNVDPRWNDPNPDVAKQANLGYCRHYLPGRYQIDGAFNDKASSLKVNNGMVGYLSSGDFPPDIAIGVSLSSPTDTFNPSATVFVGSSGGWVLQAYRVVIPPSCAQPNVRETTKNGDAHWSGSWKPGAPLLLNLRVQYRQLLQGVWKGYANNWVGVELTCKSVDDGTRSWGG